ncbi:MAG: manganese transporter [Flavobacteriaceae bacterium CG_4_8_14_3_um_filter_34_10]|nr:divalent metal cation transporter [Flavobacteriia bacterium]OIP50129.1 MAG: manganese transporter [Flavobacteriaceae bacterium CG2_30_34_30]PIQ18321.1 MAG: manganese transporter [Flavobacteriaceae bacterium CG18_big_fil_WC_8_21_14_2_50_34_36]PIV49444.1 MAG: manganese transporter [Flavobacteriaceae bacterium CG02_land_8_20_14_3_00_34_13]PIX10237.1 MAG: manganese transporter [Flavobacteriaceae bacterium CG_4_8_14_3_um_filter_34_10]PIZ08238.1 MAG: manganese transporter [Flavobacteriaceae bacte
MSDFFKNIGPGSFIAAAFIGPGTVTVCSLAGVQFGFTLLWAMVLSILATLVLQEMVVRLGLVYGQGLAETVIAEIASPFLKVIAILIILSAIIIGNAAYEAGNISGGVLGLQTFFNENTIAFIGLRINFLSILIGAISFVLLFIGNYKSIERSLIGLVILMSVSFLVTAIITKPDMMKVMEGIFVPKLPKEGLLMVLGLVGTTVVPYNLFLHAALVQEKWKGVKDLKVARKDALVSILLGGVVSIAIIVCAAAIGQNEIKDLSGLAKGLEPLYGSFSKYFLSIGLFSAGITSAITAPLAAAYVAKECFGWNVGLKSAKFRSVWMFVLFMGVIFSSLGLRPIEIIKFAQVANGLLLPIVAGFLLWVVNRNSVLGAYKNSKIQNILGILILVTTIVLGGLSLLKVFKIV